VSTARARQSQCSSAAKINTRQNSAIHTDQIAIIDTLNSRQYAYDWRHKLGHRPTNSRLSVSRHWQWHACRLGSLWSLYGRSYTPAGYGTGRQATQGGAVPVTSLPAALEVLFTGRYSVGARLKPPRQVQVCGSHIVAPLWPAAIPSASRKLVRKLSVTNADVSCLPRHTRLC